MGFIDKVVHRLDDQYNSIEYKNDKITEIKKNIEGIISSLISVSSSLLKPNLS